MKEKAIKRVENYIKWLKRNNMFMGENTQAIEDLLLLAQEQEEKLDYKNQEIRRLEKEICDLQDQILFYKKELKKEYKGVR